jgi:hypothetical protein
MERARRHSRPGTGVRWWATADIYCGADTVGEAWSAGLVSTEDQLGFRVLGFWAQVLGFRV